MCKWRSKQTSECIIVKGLLCASPLLHIAAGVWYWREANREISGDALNALMQSNCFQIYHWWTVSFQPFNYLHRHTHTHSNSSTAVVSCSKSGHRYNALCSTLCPLTCDPKVLLHRELPRWPGWRTNLEQEVMAGREREGLVEADWYIPK